jgi:hypothetical protein
MRLALSTRPPHPEEAQRAVSKGEAGIGDIT